MGFRADAPVQAPLHHWPGEVRRKRVERSGSIDNEACLTANPSPHTFASDDGQVEVTTVPRLHPEALVQLVQVLADRWQLRANAHPERTNFDLNAGCVDSRKSRNENLSRSAVYWTNKTGVVHE